MPKVASKKSIKDNPFVWFSLIVVLIALGTAAYFMTFWESSKVLAVVGGEKITQDDLDKAVSDLVFSEKEENSSEIPDYIVDQVFEELIEKKIIDLSTKEMDISFSDEELDERARAINSSYDDLTFEEKLILRNNAKFYLTREKIENQLVYWSEGKFIIARFDSYFYQDPSNKPESEREKLTEENKVYAKTFIDSVYKDIVDGKITFEEGIEKTNNDSRVGKDSWYSYIMTMSQSYTKEDSISKRYPNNSPDFWDIIKQAEVNKVSVPVAFNVFLGEQTFMGDLEEEVEAGYLIVKKEKENKSEYSSYEDWLEAEKTKLKVKIFR